MARHLISVVCAIALIALCGCNELLLEVEFDLHPVQSLTDGYTATDSINSFLQSTDLKWLRHFTNVVSSKPGGIRMRTTHMMFKDPASWAAFEQEYLHKYNALFEHFWVNSRRVIWHVAPSETGVVFPRTVRTEGVNAGYVYQISYSPIPGKEKELKAEWRRAVGPFIKDLEANSGFLERSHYTSGAFQTEYTDLIQYDFMSMQALATSMFGEAYLEMFNRLKPYIDEQTVTILAPGADEAFYWPAQGADKAPEGEL